MPEHRLRDRTDHESLRRRQMREGYFISIESHQAAIACLCKRQDFRMRIRKFPWEQRTQPAYGSPWGSRRRRRRLQSGGMISARKSVQTLLKTQARTGLIATH